VCRRSETFAGVENARKTQENRMKQNGSVAKASRRSALTQPKEVSVKITLPADLEEWASRTAFNMNQGLSEWIKDHLEYERYRDEKLVRTLGPGFDMLARRFLGKKGGAR
jgi:hypothetical protein